VSTPRALHGMRSSRRRRQLVLAVPELTRSAGIQLNERVSLPRPIEILSSIRSCGLANAASTGHAYRAIGGRCCVIEGSGPAHSPSQSTIFGAGAA
jgi:hypothetical protein